MKPPPPRYGAHATRNGKNSSRHPAECEVIRRTLVYGTLTALLAGIYFVGVLGVQTVTQHLTGQSGQQPIVIVATTLLIAVLFTPLRHRVQTGIDRAFYRSKYDAAQTLAAFGERLRTETDLDNLRVHVVEVVQRTMQPAHVTLWLRTPSQHNVETSTGESTPPR